MSRARALAREFAESQKPHFMDKPRMRFYHWRGVRYVAAHAAAPPAFARCGTCGRAWDDGKATAWTPAPAGRCPFEHWHRRST